MGSFFCRGFARAARDAVYTRWAADATAIENKILFRSHADSPLKDLLLVGSHADSRFKSRQARGLVFVLEATQTADSGTFFVRKPRRRPIQEPPTTSFLFRSHTDSRFKDLLLVGSHADSRFKSRQARGLVFCLEATQTADSRTFFVRLEATQTADSRATKPEDLFLFGSHADSRFKDVFLFGSHADSRSKSHRKATQTADSRTFCWLEVTQTAESRALFLVRIKFRLKTSFKNSICIEFRQSWVPKSYTYKV